MTSGQESSDRARKPHKPPEIESLAGTFHPHAIEVQDFSHYALVIDVRTPQEYEEDHIPGAVQFSPAVVSQGPLVTGHADDRSRTLVAHDSGAEGELPPALAALVSPLKLDQAILVYCGRGGLDSLPVARALRWRGWSVDVLPGGWINYRRWVQAGLEVLPRMVSFRVIATSLGCEADRVLNALASVGHQVLNVEALMVRRRGSIACRSARQPSQAWLESQLLQRLRAVDPRRPVWVGDVDGQVGELRLPGSMAGAGVSAHRRARGTARGARQPLDRRRVWLGVAIDCARCLGLNGAGARRSHRRTMERLVARQPGRSGCQRVDGAYRSPGGQPSCAAAEPSG